MSQVFTVMEQVSEEEAQEAARILTKMRGFRQRPNESKRKIYLPRVRNLKGGGRE